MWICKRCKKRFKKPESRKLDAGFSEGILGWQRERHSILICPKCASLKIERKAG